MHARPVFLKPVYEEIFQAALPFLQTRQNELHTIVCLQFASRLFESEGGDPDIVFPAVALHDVGWSRVPENLQLLAFGPKMTRTDLRDLHEREGAVIAREILAKVGFPTAHVEAVATIVSRHDSGLRAESLEEGIVKDADKLWRFSREGVATDAKRFQVSVSDHLSQVGEALAGWFLTPGGRRLAREELGERKSELGAARPSSEAAERPLAF